MATVLMMCMHVVLATAGGIQDAEGWTSKDIGGVATPGTARYNQEAMMWIVQGAGADIYGTADSFQYVYQPFKGDGFIIARVESIRKTNPWAKVGIMIRESMDPDSRFAAVYATPDYGVRFQARAYTADEVRTDTVVVTDEQRALEVPVRIKLERKGDEFYGYYATDGRDDVWTPMVWSPQTIAMSETVHAGLAVTSHMDGTLCEARISGVSVNNLEGVLSGVEVTVDPSLALERAYDSLQRLGNWRDDTETKQRHGDLIAGFLFTIAKGKEFRGEPADTVVPDYYRIAELLPDSSINALIQIAVLDGERGLEYALQHLAGRPREEQDRFYETVIKGYGSLPGPQERETAVKSFVAYVGSTSHIELLERIVVALAGDEHALSICQSLIRLSMASASNEQIAVTGLRYMALKLGADLVQKLASWAAIEFEDTRLAACAMAAMADLYYDQGQYVEAVHVFHPGLLRKGSSESSIIANMDAAVAAYRGSTLRHSVMDLDDVYNILGQKAERQGLHAVALHCYRTVAVTRGVSLSDFEQSAVKGIKHCASSPENEVWFWKGLVAADEGDLGIATVAYERFLQGDNRSVLAARAYYDIARTKMAIGEDAKEWIAKAKALSPCNVVIQLERQLNTRVSRG